MTTPDGVPVILHHGTPGGRHLFADGVRDAPAAADVAAIADALGVGRFATRRARGPGGSSGPSSS